MGGQKRRIKIPRVYCRAHKKTGERCKNAPINGGAVCRWHGGAAPAVKEAARLRVLASLDRAAFQIVSLMEDAETPHAVKLAAAKDLLDRGGLAAKQVVDIEVKPWQALLEGISSERPSDAPAISPEVRAEIESGDDDDTIVDAELVEDEPPIARDGNALELPDNVTLLRGSVGPYGPPPPPLQTHEERYGAPEPSPGRNRPRRKGKRGPRDGR